MKKLNVSHHTDGLKFPSGIKTASELAEIVGMSVDRINELAEAHYLPHWRIDGGEPMFYPPEVKKWIAANLMERIDGKSMPIHLKISIEPPKAVDAPASIREIDGLRELPPTNCPPGVYFLIKDEQVVYVGQSLNPHARVMQHKDKVFDRVYMIPVPSSELDAVEGALIRALNPILNTGAKDIAIGPGDRTKDSEYLSKYGVALSMQIEELK